MHTITSELVDVWRSRNDNGEGFSVGLSWHSPHAAARYEDDYIILDERDNDCGEVLCRDNEDRLILICACNGPWACYVD